MENRKYCPVNGTDCPYYLFGSGLCDLDNPANECDDYASLIDEDEDKEDDRLPKDYLDIINEMLDTLIKNAQITIKERERRD